MVPIANNLIFKYLVQLNTKLFKLFISVKKLGITFTLKFSLKLSKAYFTSAIASEFELSVYSVLIWCFKGLYAFYFKLQLSSEDYVSLYFLSNCTQILHETKQIATKVCFSGPIIFTRYVPYFHLCWFVCPFVR